MFGFIFGTICLITLARLVHHTRRMRRWAWMNAGAYGSSNYAFHDHDRDSAFGGWGSSWQYPRNPSPVHVNAPQWMHAVFYDIGATPVQQQALVDTFTQAQRRVREVLPKLRSTRQDIANAIRGQSLDESALGSAIAHQDEVVSTTRSIMMDALARIHETLDARQRQVLADRIANGKFPAFGVNNF